MNSCHQQKLFLNSTQFLPRSHGFVYISLMAALSQLPAALPRPHSIAPVSPSAKPVPQEPVKPVSQQVPVTPDLLNLGSDDIFDAFLSAPVSSSSENGISSSQSLVGDNVSTKSSISNDEADFFNQKSDGIINQSSKMTKESILSLYSSNSCQVPAPQHIAPIYGIPAGGMYVSQQAYAQVAMTGFPTVPAAGINAVSS
ncbi:stromal membrane-associated protein 2 [Trichonephila clavata]|uniref:Stromal membrane-associated protein 2 n=1 Tax=Trichonephila clavata TaxID=2740835 RepID=A0A8X6JXU6_TRICU|nr:stromal membrane-associated protein 2 [Trichonephila clavata]